MDSRPIGVFDSGVGGLTVVKGIRNILPNESIVYIGDTARVPYGTRSDEVIQEYAVEVAAKVMEQDIKALVIACNTVSAVAMNEVLEVVDGRVPVFGVINPTALYALKRTENKRIGVIGTPATIKSKAYEKRFQELDATVSVVGRATPLLVPLIEEGVFNGGVMQRVLHSYLDDFVKPDKLDVLILGCTHYPLIRGAIKQLVGEDVIVVDSAKATAFDLKRYLEEHEMLANGAKPTQIYFTSDSPEQEMETARMFLGDDLKLNRVEL